MSILFIISLGIIITLRSVHKVYKQVPLSELKRRAKKDNFSRSILKAAQYGVLLDVVTGVILSLFIAVALFALHDLATIWFLAVASIIICYAFVWPRNTKSISVSKMLATKLAPFFGTLARWSSPVLNLLLPLTLKQQKSSTVFETSDLIDFLLNQKSVANSRISHAQLNELIAVLRKGDRHIKDLMVKRKNMKVLSPDDEVGPVLLSELHESQQSVFIVEEAEQGIVGTTSLRALSNQREGGKVERTMRRNLFFVHKDWALDSVFGAFLETKSSEFLVVDDAEKVVGIITLEQVIDASLDPAELDNKPNYSDAASVASSSK